MLARMIRPSLIGAVLGLVLGSIGCGRARSADVLPDALDGEERAALEAVLADASVDRRSVLLVDDLYDLPWRGAESHARAHGRGDRAEAARRRFDDTRNAIVITGGHVVGLRLGGTKLATVANVVRLKHLVLLDLHDSQLTEAPLDGLTELDHLVLAGNRLTSLVTVGRLPALRSLDASHNVLHRIDGLQELPALETLHLASTWLHKIEGLAHLRRLRSLSLERNPIERIEGLEELTELDDLNLSYCWITRIENLSSSKKLLYLNLWHNGIAELTGVEGLTHLVYLGLGENRVNPWLPPNQQILATWGNGRLVNTF